MASRDRNRQIAATVNGMIWNMSRVFHTVLLVWGGRTQLSARSAEFRREAATFVDNLCVFCLVIMAFF